MPLRPRARPRAFPRALLGSRGASLVARGRKGMLADLMDDGVDGPAKKAERTTCPCGSGLEYDACCGALHAAGVLGERGCGFIRRYVLSEELVLADELQLVCGQTPCQSGFVRQTLSCERREILHGFRRG